MLNVAHYVCAEIRLPPCICTCLDALYARTIAGFRLNLIRKIYQPS